MFLSLDLFLLFVFYEIAVVPKYFLIAIWGGARRQFAAMKLVLYSFGGSALVLLGMLAVFFLAHDASGEALKTFSLRALQEGQVPAAAQQWIFPVIFVGFAIMAGRWPFHTWAPTGHVAGRCPSVERPPAGHYCKADENHRENPLLRRCRHLSLLQRPQAERLQRLAGGVVC